LLKKEIKYQKFKNKVLLEVFGRHKLKIKNKNHQISIFDLQCARKNIKSCLMICMTYLINSQIWLSILQ
jgi:hypothetical protein